MTEQQTDWRDELRVQYPRLFANKPELSVGTGWRTLVTHICALFDAPVTHAVERLASAERCLAEGGTLWKLEDVEAARADVERAQATEPRIAQIKEKFGGLRFYYDGGTAYHRGAVELAEALSFHLCEACGAPGRVRNHYGWYQTLCDDHAAAVSQQPREGQ